MDAEPETDRQGESPPPCEVWEREPGLDYLDPSENHAVDQEEVGDDAVGDTTKPNVNAELEANKKGENHGERRFPWITLVGTTASQAEGQPTDSLRDDINALGEEDMEGHSTASASDSMATTVPWMAAPNGTMTLFPNLAGGTQLDFSESPTEQAFAAVRACTLRQARSLLVGG